MAALAAAGTILTRNRQDAAQLGRRRTRQRSALPTGTGCRICDGAAHFSMAQVAVVDADSGQTLNVGQRLVTTDGVMRRWDGFVARGDGATATERLQRQNRLDALAAQRPQVELGVQELRDRRDAVAAKATALAEAATAARKALAQADEARRTALRAADQAQAALDRHRDAATLFDRRLGEIAAAAAKPPGARGAGSGACSAPRRQHRAPRSTEDQAAERALTPTVPRRPHRA